MENQVHEIVAFTKSHLFPNRLMILFKHNIIKLIQTYEDRRFMVYNQE